MPLPVPVLATEVPGNYLTAALWLANVYNPFQFLLNPPMFFGYQATAQSVANNSATPITLDMETFDTYGGHSTTTNTSRYVAQVAGTYLVTGTTAWVTNATDERVTGFAKNGTIIVGGSQVQSPTLSGHVSVVQGTWIPVALNVGDYVEVWGTQTSGAALSTQADAALGKNSALACVWIHA